MFGQKPDHELGVPGLTRMRAALIRNLSGYDCLRAPKAKNAKGQKLLRDGAGMPIARIGRRGMGSRVQRGDHRTAQRCQSRTSPNHGRALPNLAPFPAFP
jgi:hypothetical protein